jgi:hypothetical protein
MCFVFVFSLPVGLYWNHFAVLVSCLVSFQILCLLYKSYTPWMFFLSNSNIHLNKGIPWHPCAGTRFWSNLKVKCQIFCVCSINLISLEGFYHTKSAHLNIVMCRLPVVAVPAQDQGHSWRLHVKFRKFCVHSKSNISLRIFIKLGVFTSTWWYAKPMQLLFRLKVKVTFECQAI